MKCSSGNRSRARRGEEITNHRLTEEDVKDIRYKHKWKNDTIAKAILADGTYTMAREYGVHSRTIERAVYQLDCAHTSLSTRAVADIRARNDRRVEKIRRTMRAGSSRSLARQYGVHARTIDKVLSFETWKHVGEI